MLGTTFKEAINFLLEHAKGKGLAETEEGRKAFEECVKAIPADYVIQFLDTFFHIAKSNCGIDKLDRGIMMLDEAGCYNEYQEEKRMLEFLNMKEKGGWVMAYYGSSTPNEPSGWQVVCHISKLKLYLADRVHKEQGNLIRENKDKNLVF